MAISNNPTSIPASSNFKIPSQVDRRAMLKAARASKKLRYLDDPVIVAASEIIACQEWLIKRGKPTPATKARIKKAADLARREKKKEEVRYKKAQETVQSNDIRRIAIGNCQRAEVGSFCALLSDSIRPDPLDIEEIDDPNLPTSPIRIIQSAASKKIKAQGLQQIQESRMRKKSTSTATALANRLQRQANSDITNPIRKSVTPPPMPMELRPGKRKVKVTAHAVDSTPPKRMRART